MKTSHLCLCLLLAGMALCIPWSLADGVRSAIPGHPVSEQAIPAHMEIEGPFEDGSDVTETCLDCHEDAAADFMQSTHWTWSGQQQVFGRGPVPTGKRHAINNFCYGVASNLSMCTQCHAGYGWKDDGFDFDDPANIDCLVCHDSTGDYRRLSGDGGVADPGTDFERVARRVANPGRANCGGCHFHAGSGHAVKHGDLEEGLLAASRELDVHMATDGANLNCQDCHVTEHHRIAGTAMAATPGGGKRVACEDCHRAPVHGKVLLNQHARTLACQTCHIPRYARGAATKLRWDWSAAGPGHEVEKDAAGDEVYVPYKGRFEWGRDVVPHYAWFNGLAGVHAWGDRIDPDDEVLLNWPLGNRTDEGARIYPFKVHRGRQIYDAQNLYLVNPLLVTDDGFAYARDWDKAARLGMQARGLAYSGEYDFVDTLMYLRVNHTVAPASEALSCRDCHGPGQQRMDWSALGYGADPLYVRGQARFPLTR